MGPVELKPWASHLRGNTMTHQENCVILLQRQTPSDPEKLVCSAPLLLRHKIATNKMFVLRGGPSSWDALIPSKVSKLHRGRCAEQLIPTQAGEGLQNFCFQALDFPSKTVPGSNLSWLSKDPSWEGMCLCECACNICTSGGNPVPHMLAPTVFFKCVYGSRLARNRAQIPLS